MPGSGLEPGHAAFGQRRRIGEIGNPCGRADGQQPEPAVLDERRHRIDGVGHEIDLASHQVHVGGGAAFVRHMTCIHVVVLHHLKSRQVRDIAVASRAVGELAFVLLRVLHELLHGVGRHLGIDDKPQWHHRRQGHGAQIPGHVIAHLLVERRTERNRGSVVEHGVAVGWRLGHQRIADVAVGTRPVVHDDRLPQLLAYLLRQHPRHHVCGTAGRERDDQRDRLAGPVVLRLRRTTNCQRGNGRRGNGEQRRPT